MNLNIITLSLIAGIAYSLQNITEKYIFNKDTNINIVKDYFLTRMLFTFLIFLTIYLLSPKIINIIFNTNYKNKKVNISNSLNNLLLFIINYWFITLIASVFFVISVYFMLIGLNKYPISKFTPIFLISYLCINIIAGYLLFNEIITIYKILGLILAIISIILFYI